MNNKRKIILDTETTGINRSGLPHINHRIIEIGAVEIINRRFTGNNFHAYVKPNRSIELSALKIHGISDDFLSNKPFFKDIAKSFLNYIFDSELIIHNAPFDIGFINQELKILYGNKKNILNLCSVTDTLSMARKFFPGKKNTLNALCNRYKINISHRASHSAILDAKLLGKLYLLMTGGQESFLFSKNIKNKKSFSYKMTSKEKKINLKILKATKEEIKSHEKYLKYMKDKKICLWY
ncbi:DNA polymerase III subunit epsilon [Buchnera aphidicola (Muscaphis stroyani)]|uniref:DNA polymerase III subunit epsilon n=1 Tax=Buchnera aphidicola (Muscaphis stroyani) TaxID=1241869 RepID=A0A4D6YFI3_9GAMM|nr:DNA polymerase III subunit epsilon [Buchnera aphidicola]QCI24644.1 DNA polymerase III subunit epsilon [Buchnera aphidicola (Muscaphis stroyani)]